MKKWMKRPVILIAALLLICVGAIAAGNGIRNLKPLNGATVEVLKGDDSVVSASGDVYSDAKKFKITKTVSDGAYLAVICKSNSGNAPVPDETNTYYMGVADVSGGEINITTFPKDMDDGKYVIAISDLNNDGKLQTVATFEVGSTPVTTYKLGDIDGQVGYTPTDALIALQIAAEPRSADFEDWQKIAADVDGQPGVTPTDALCILQKAADPTNYRFPGETN